MNRIFGTLLLSLMTCAFTSAQTVIYQQNFENPATMDWNLNTINVPLGSNGPGTNLFVVNDVYPGFPGVPPIVDTDDQPAAITNSPNGFYLHTLAETAQTMGVLNCNYLDIGISGSWGEVITVETPDVSTIGYTGVSLDFWWLCGDADFGGWTSGGSITYSVNGGTTWLNVPGVWPYSSSTWTQEILANPVFDNQATLRFAFSFNADMGAIESLGFALDQFKISGTSVCDNDLGPAVNVCFGDSVTIDAGVGFDNYLWNTGDTTQTITLFAAAGLDTFWVTVDSVGCATTDSVEVLFNSEITIDNVIATNTSACALLDGSITYVANGGTPFLSSTANFYTAFVEGMVNDTTNIIGGLGAGPYDLVVYDSLGCSAATTALIEEGGNTININNIIPTVDCSSYGEIQVNAVNTSGNPMFYSSNGGLTYEDNGGVFTAVDMGQPYEIWVTDNICTAFDTTTFVLTSPEINVSNITVKDVDCFGTTDAYIVIDVVGGSGNYQVQVDGGAWYADTIPNIGAGVYDIVAQDLSSLCTDTLYSEAITQQGGGVAIEVSVVGSVDGIGIPCSGDCSGELMVEVIGGTPFADGSYAIDWQDNSGSSLSNSTVGELLDNYTSNVLDICEGTYFVTVWDSICPNPAVGTVTIAANTPVLNTFLIDSVNCFNGADGSLVANPTGGIPPYTYDWGSYGEDQGIADLAIGTYTVIVTDDVGCPSSFSAEINQPNPLIVDASIVSEVSCYSESDGVLGVNAYGGTGSYGFVWSHPDYPWVDDAVNNTQVLGSLPPSVGADDIEQDPDYQSYSDPYLVTVTDWNGCESTSEIYLIEPPQLEVFLTQPTHPAYCANSDLGMNTGWAQVTASGGTPNANDNYTFVWSALAQTNQDVLYSEINDVTSGTYAVTAIDDRLCAAGTDVVIELEATWEAYPTSTDASCYMENDGSVSIQMQGGCGDPDNSCTFYYVWNGGAATGNTLPDVYSLQQGNYSVVVTDDWGCEATYTVVVNGPDLVEFQVTSLENQSCFSDLGASADGTVEVSAWGGNAPYDISWTEASTGTAIGTAQTSDDYQITGLGADVWTIDVTDINNCVGVFDISSLNPNPFVIDDGVEVTASINPGELFLTDTIHCYGEETAAAQVLNPNPDFDYTWFVDGNTTVLDQGISTTSLPAGDIVVQASYLLDLCTAVSVPVTIVEQPSFDVQDNSIMPTCFGDGDAVIDLVITGATPHLNNDQAEDYNFTWSPSGLNGLGVVNENGSLEFSIPNQSSGTYYLEIVDRYGCDTVYTVNIVDPNQITQQITPTDLSCHPTNAAADGTIQIDAIGGVGPYDFFLGATSNAASNSYTYLNLSANTYNIHTEDANGCSSAIVPITISQPPALIVDVVSVLDVSCNGYDNGEFQVDGVGGTQPYAVYTIAGAGTASNNTGMFTALAPGNYTISVQDANGCADQVNQAIDEPSTLNTPVLVVTDANCFAAADGSIDLSINGGTAPYAYFWSNGDNTEDLEYITAGEYSVDVVDENGCPQAATATVNEPTEVQAGWLITTPGTYNNETVLSQTAPFTASFVDTSANADVALTEWWVNGEDQTASFYGVLGYAEHLFVEMGEYEVMMYAYNTNGCWDTISVDITVQGLKEFDVFTPNGDEVNDYFFFENYGISELNAVFYNRWGDKIYELDTPEGKWDGVSMNGQEVPEGVYFYVLNAKGADGSQYSEKGSVTLYR